MMLTCLLLSLYSGTPMAKAAPVECLKLRAMEVAVQHGLDPYLFLSIIEQESNWKVNAYNHRTKDYGLSQINERNIRVLKLDKQRLLNDPTYSLNEGAKILAWFSNRYKHRERLWFARYNCGTRALPVMDQPKCLKYADRINEKLNINLSRRF